MAHQLTQRKNGFIEFAASGNRSEVWHKLGQYLPEGQSIEQWQVAAGMDWEIFESNVRYQTPEGITVDPSRKVLYRSDGFDVLSVVSDEYCVVQPKQVLEFFREFTEINQMKLSAAGTLFGGKRFWAIAELDKSAEIVDGDTINGYLLLTTSADGTLSTQAKFTSTRVVCNNTLSIALNEKGKVVRKTHASEFNAKEFKVDLGLIDSGWDKFVTNLKNLANQKVSDDFAKEFFAKLALPNGKTPIGLERNVDALMHFYQKGAGSEMHYGTKWGVLNAVTEMQTHGTFRSARDRQFDKSEFGTGDKVKTLAYFDLVAQ
jgi:phage/plasmid-like protein (TIGR03299 family)